MNRAFQLHSKAQPTEATCEIGAAKLILEAVLAEHRYNGAGKACLMCVDEECGSGADALSQFVHVLFFCPCDLMI